LIIFRISLLQTLKTSKISFRELFRMCKLIQLYFARWRLRIL